MCESQQSRSSARCCSAFYRRAGRSASGRAGPTIRTNGEAHAVWPVKEAVRTIGDTRRRHPAGYRRAHCRSRPSTRRLPAKVGFLAAQSNAGAKIAAAPAGDLSLRLALLRFNRQSLRARRVSVRSSHGATGVSCRPERSGQRSVYLGLAGTSRSDADARTVNRAHCTSSTCQIPCTRNDDSSSCRQPLCRRNRHNGQSRYTQRTSPWTSPSAVFSEGSSCSAGARDRA